MFLGNLIPLLKERLKAIQDAGKVLLEVIYLKLKKSNRRNLMVLFIIVLKNVIEVRKICST